MTERKVKPPARSKDLPATQGMLMEVRKELKADVRELRHDMNAGFRKIDARFSRVDARFNEVDARFNKVDARFSEVDSRFETLESMMQKMLSMQADTLRRIEQQASENRIVLEHLTGLFARQDRLEKEMADVQTDVRYLKALPPKNPTQ